MSFISVLKGIFHKKKTFGEQRRTPEFQNEVIKCKECGLDIGTRRDIREVAEDQGWNSSRAIGVTMPCPSCGTKQMILL